MKSYEKLMLNKWSQKRILIETQYELQPISNELQKSILPFVFKDAWVGLSLEFHCNISLGDNCYWHHFRGMIIL